MTAEIVFVWTLSDIAQLCGLGFLFVYVIIVFKKTK